MTPEVLARLAELRPTLADLPQIALLSPSKEERALFPRATVLTRKDWDLDERRLDLRFDLIIACNVFHYAAAPLRWFDNVTASCRAFLLTDLIRRKRSPESELGRDEDRMRYAYREHRPSVETHFDLGELGPRLLALRPFVGATNEYGSALHFWGLVQGQLGGPLIRLDSFSEATRDLPALAAVLSQFREHRLALHLGVESGYLSAAGLALLRNLEQLEPAVQGEAARWRMRSEREKILVLAKRRLEHALDRVVRTYIPARGALDRFTARLLGLLGFELCLCERSVEGRYFYSRKADFAGPSSSFSGHPSAEVLAFHLPTEARLHARGQKQDLARALHQVTEARAAKERAISELARELAR